ncbi:MAG: type VI secretion system tip protein TssI/VgrG, partial [Pseudomonadota bacterium]
MPDQSRKIVHLQSSLGESRAAVVSLTGREAVNDLYTFQVSVIADNDPIMPEEILGEEVMLTMRYSDVERVVHGVVASISETEAAGDNVFEYSLEIVPKLWLLSLSAHTRIFEEMTVPDIVKSVVADGCGMAVEVVTSTSYRKREMCVQFEESDLQFVQRLLQDEGIAFYFKQTPGSATLVLSDSVSGFPNCQPSSYPYSERDNAAWRTGVSGFRRAGRIATGEIVSRDFTEYAPSNPLEVKSKSRAKAKLRPGIRQVYGQHDFDNPGARTLPRGACADQAKVWLESLESDADFFHGESAAPSLIPGHKISLSDAPVCSDGDKQYLLLEVFHSASEGLDSESVYSNWFKCAPSSNTVSFLPSFTLERPRVWGVQTATVVDVRNPGDPESHGEVKIRFHWEPDQFSCWARVGQLYAGNRWGGYFIPDVGQEVLVEFINGDPDRPVVVGAVYNRDNTLPPYTKTQSGIRTRSSDFNELRFDDEDGDEEVYFQAGRDHNFLIKNDETGDIGNDETLTVGNNRTIDVGNDHSLSAGANISLEARSSITLKVGGSEIKMDPTGVTITGSMIKIKGNATTEVSAGAVVT